VAWSAPLDLSEVKVVGKALGCTVNDVLMATVAGALGAYLRELRRFDSDALGLRASVPVNLRSTDEALSLGNKFGLVFVDLPVGTRNPIERVLHVHATMDALKGSLQPAMTLVALGTMGLLPAALQAPAIELFSRKGTLVASNVPGPQTPLRLCGQRIREMYFWVPQSGSIGLGFSLLSYAGQVFVGAIADRNVLPRPRRLVERFSREFERLVLATTVGVLGARRMTARDAQPARRRTTSAQATRRRPADTPAENT
jgi:WS/DGAT/MGAT family acyltransferase